MYTAEQHTKVKVLARVFLAIADELNEEVSAYFNGSNEGEDIAAYNIVSRADKDFIDALNEYEGEKHPYGLNYELAEAIIG